MNVLIALIVAAASGIITIHVDTAHPVNTIRPLRAIGVGIDSDPEGKVPLLYSPDRTRLMLAAGLGVVSYRLYTELSIQDWHWNPAGSFSDAAHHQGYWTSSASTQRPPIVDSYGYALPHRGSTRDQGDDDGYSRIDDGDPTTYWKSDPYLAHQFTADPDSAHPQWAVIDFIHPKSVDAIRIHWASPYATRYVVQYWTGGDAIVAQSSGAWHTFPGGVVNDGKGGNAFIRLSRVPIALRFVRILMTASSDTCDMHGASDQRNCSGYAIQDIELGLADEREVLTDRIRHHKCGGDPERRSDCGTRQTIIFVSSIDPWHSATDRVRSGQDQPGLDFVSRNAITRGLPMMYAVPLFYSTPQNAAAQVRYLAARGYPLDHIEMGEEVDGQYAMPEDYAALYVQWARAIHAVYPAAKLGGPIFEGVNSDVKVWRNASGDDSWLRRFLKYLRSHGHMGDLAFMSFEHYPFRGCDQGVTLHVDLLREPALVRGIIDTWHADGLPTSVPMYITESNFASNGGPVPKQLEGALWMADWIGTALSSGVAGVNYYQYEAEPLGHSRQCDKYGDYGMFITDDNYRILAKSAQYYGAQMLTQEWLQPGDAVHTLFPVTTDQLSKNPPVSAYAARRPDGKLSIMIVNKDSQAQWVIIKPPEPMTEFRSDDTITFGARQYSWKGDSPTEIPLPGTGPLRDAGRAHGHLFQIPALSITVIRGATYNKALIDRSEPVLIPTPSETGSAP